MSKIKWGKLLVGAVAIGAAIAGGIAYFSKKNQDDVSFDDDFDEFDDELDDDDIDVEPIKFHTVNREYVSIPKEGVVASSDIDDTSDSDDSYEPAAAASDAEPSSEDIEELKVEIDTEKELAKEELDEEIAKEEHKEETNSY